MTDMVLGTKENVPMPAESPVIEGVESPEKKIRTYIKDLQTGELKKFVPGDEVPEGFKVVKKSVVKKTKE